jgi:hypothetical protein
VIILLIHSQYIVKLYKILLLYLSGPASAQVNTYSIAGFLCPGICGMTRLGGMGAGGRHPDFAVQPAPLQFRAEQSLRHGGTTDISGTNHQHGEGWLAKKWH